MAGGRRGAAGRGAVSRRPPTRTTADRRPAVPSHTQTPHRVDDQDLDSASAAVCGSCSNSVGVEAIGCDQCGGWFHPTSLCMGLPERVIDNIVELNGDGILFICLTCRLGSHSPSGAGGNRRNGDQDGAVFKQLHEMVMALCRTVKTLSEKVEKLVTAQNAKSPPLTDYGTRQIIREEVREVHERDLRKDSIILRGFSHLSVAEVQGRFRDISMYLLNKDIPLSDITCINQEKGLFRAKIIDNQDRKSLLSVTYKLKQSPNFGSLYVHRDLTFKQREELRSRRATLRETGGGTLDRAASSDRGPSGDAPAAASATSGDDPLNP